MPANPSAHRPSAQQNEIQEIRRHIKILSVREQQDILTRLSQVNEVTDELRTRIADALDRAVLAEGGADALRAERDENARILTALAGDGAALEASTTPDEREEQGAFVKGAIAQQRQIYDNYRGSLASVDRSLSTQMEASAESGNQQKIQDLYEDLNGPDLGQAA